MNEKQFKKDKNLFIEFNKINKIISKLNKKIRNQLKIDFPIGSNLMIRINENIGRATVTEFPDYWLLSDNTSFCVKYINTGRIKKIIAELHIICKCDKNWNQITGDEVSK